MNETPCRTNCGQQFNGRLAAYLAAAGAAGPALAADEAAAAIVGSTAVVPFGINEEVNIDFNSDGAIDFQIDHDRVDLGGVVGAVDYLQIDKNDGNSATNPLPFDNGTFPAPMGVTPNDAEFMSYVVGDGAATGAYPSALPFGTEIGPSRTFDFQESENFGGTTGLWIRANRLIDEDQTQIDQDPAFGNHAMVQVPADGPNFVGLGGEVGYLGVRMDLNDTGLLTYGWIGIRITNEADATGEVVGWAYENTGLPIAAGANVPEPSTVVTTLIGGATIAGCWLWRRLRGN